MEAGATTHALRPSFSSSKAQWHITSLAKASSLTVNILVMEKLLKLLIFIEAKATPESVPLNIGAQWG